MSQKALYERFALRFPWNAPLKIDSQRRADIFNLPVAELLPVVRPDSIRDAPAEERQPQHRRRRLSIHRPSNQHDRLTAVTFNNPRRPKPRSRPGCTVRKKHIPLATSSPPCCSHWLHTTG